MASNSQVSMKTPGKSGTRTSASALTMSIIEKNLREGGEFRVPSLGITLTKEKLLEVKVASHENHRNGKQSD